ncbi:MAG: DMT family transporter, partial [Verrucomicrobiota bacterium]|nr:DMT family transporter [Verrucomicrobiota bacterium]
MFSADAGAAKAASRKKLHAPSVVALISGAVAIGFAPILVRFSETGPTATAFWRIFLALPFLAIWRGSERDQKSWPSKTWWWVVACGALFAGDLAVWHQSIKWTTVANATLFANFAPIFVVAFGFLFLRERVTARFLFAMVAALGGTILLVGGNLGAERTRIYGDLLG